jgi:hypothetical protein
MIRMINIAIRILNLVLDLNLVTCTKFSNNMHILSITNQHIDHESNEAMTMTRFADWQCGMRHCQLAYAWPSGQCHTFEHVITYILKKCDAWALALALHIPTKFSVTPTTYTVQLCHSCTAVVLNLVEVHNRTWRYSVPRGTRPYGRTFLHHSS